MADQPERWTRKEVRSGPANCLNDRWLCRRGGGHFAVVDLRHGHLVGIVKPTLKSCKDALLTSYRNGYLNG